MSTIPQGVAEVEMLQTNPGLMFDKARVQEKEGLEAESAALNKLVYDRYLSIAEQANTEGEASLMPFECYVLGVLEVKVNSDVKKAIEYFTKGSEDIKGMNYKPLESLAFQRKCLRKLEKLQRDN